MENNLKQIRNSKKLLQTKVAMDLNITQETISSYETGRVFPSSDMLIKLANYFNCSVDYLLGITDIPTHTKYLSSNSETKKSAELYSTSLVKQLKYLCPNLEEGSAYKFFGKYISREDIVEFNMQDAILITKWGKYGSRKKGLWIKNRWRI